MVYRPTPKTRDKKAARRHKLLSTAIRLFGQHGFHATTVPMIVAAAESSTGAFYLYFRNKEDVFAAALESLGGRIGEAINAAIVEAGPNPLDHMKAAVGALVRFLAQNPEEARILIIESSGLGPQLEAIRRRVIQSHTRGVERALHALAGRLPPMEPAIAASCWAGAVYEAVFHWLEQPPDQRIPPERLERAIATYNLRAIGVPESLL